MSKKRLHQVAALTFQYTPYLSPIAEDRLTRRRGGRGEKIFNLRDLRVSA